MHNCDDCNKHEALEREVKTLKDNVIELFRRIQISEIQVSKIETKVDTMIVTLNELKLKIEQLSQLPGTRWNKMVDKAMGAIVGIILGFALKKIIG